MSLAFVLLSVLLPNTTIAWMRENWSWFNWPMLLIERAQASVNLIHAILFIVLGMASRLALPHWKLGRVALSLVLLGVATELAQLFVPGRHPRLADVLVDVAAGVIGWAVMQGLVRYAVAGK